MACFTIAVGIDARRQQSLRAAVFVDAMHSLLATAILRDGLAQKRRKCHVWSIDPVPPMAGEFFKQLFHHFFLDQSSEHKLVCLPQHFDLFLDFTDQDSSTRIPVSLPSCAFVGTGHHSPPC